ncbi:hypothetical protein PENTCL1PPCAC_6047, partial [Pristionchus entomophagus]
LYRSQLQIERSAEIDKITRITQEAMRRQREAVDLQRGFKADVEEVDREIMTLIDNGNLSHAAILQVRQRQRQLHTTQIRLAHRTKQTIDRITKEVDTLFDIIQ